MRRLIITVLLGPTLGMALAAAPAVAVATAVQGSVSSNPANTPQLNYTGTTEQVRQLVPCGGTMYAVGNFTSIKHNATVYARSNIFSFGASSPYNVTLWHPTVNGVVNSIAFAGSNCTHAYIGGKFTSVNGTKVSDLAEISTTTGNVVTTFGHTAGGEVDTLAATSSGHLLVGGAFTSINGSSNKYFASLNPATGKDDGYLRLGISGTYGNDRTEVYNQQISPSGTLDLAEGVFTQVGGVPRRQIFMLSLGAGGGTVTGWTSPEFNQQCFTNESFYVRAASWSPDGSQIYIATTGLHPLGGGNHPGGLCDAAAAFPSSQTSVRHKWINYTGCDSLYSTAADASTAYFGGHERWADNPNGCNFPGPGAISALGLVGLSPADGHVIFNPGRARGLGADDMVVTSAGLWIASDNMDNVNKCAGQPGHAGICFLPYG